MNIRNRRSKHSAEVHTSALNDIMFFLMLFFLLASAVANPQVVKLLLPRSSAGEQSVAKKTVTISITEDLSYYLDKNQVPLDNIRPLLEGQIAEGEELTIIVYAAQSVPVQNLVSVIDIANQLKLRVVLATEPIKK